MRYKIDAMSSDVNQKFSTRLPADNSTISFSLRYLPTQQAWYLDFQYNNIGENNIKLVPSPNLLRSYRNILPLGLAVETDNGILPMDIEAFSSGRANLIVFDDIGVSDVEGEYFNG